MNYGFIDISFCRYFFYGFFYTFVVLNKVHFFYQLNDRKQKEKRWSLSGSFYRTGTEQKTFFCTEKK